MGFSIKIRAPKPPKITPPKIRVPKPPKITPPQPISIPVLSDFEKLVNRLTDEIINSTAKALEDISSEADRAGKNINREVAKSKESFEENLRWVKDDVDAELSRAQENIAREAQRLKDDIDVAATQAKVAIDSEATKAKGKLDKEATRLKNNIDKAATEAKANVDRELTDAREDLTTSANRLKRDIDREIKAAKEDIDDAVSAATTYLEDQTNSLIDTASETATLIQQGKLGDAIWHLATEPVNDSKSAFVKAISSSELLATAATIAVSAYGGPAGAAAFSAWLVYETTGDLDAAIRAGVAAGIAAQGGAAVNNMASETITQQVKKELVRASVNAAAVAAAGGDEEDIREAFMSSATNSLRSQADAALTKWVETDVLPRVLPETPELTQVDIVIKNPILEKAERLIDDLEDLHDQWEAVLEEAGEVENIAGVVNELAGLDDAQ